MSSEYQKFNRAVAVVQEIKRNVKGENPFMADLTGEYFALDYPNPYRRLSITFRRLVDPSKIKIRTFNWAAENEVHCIIPIELGRALYKQGLQAGFVANPQDTEV